MAEHNCPKCKQNTITWSVDTDTPLTHWGCRNCHYQAYEDESYETNCEKCGKFSKMKLKDDQTEYWWCYNCDNITPIKHLQADT